MPGNLNAAQPRPIPSFESMRIGDKPLPTSFALALRQSWTQMYDLRDYLLNLFVDDEVPNGPMNGSNKTFTLANSPIPPQSLELYRNGQFLVQGTDYNLIGKTITLAVAPFSTDTLIAFYRERLSVPNQPASQPIPPAPPTGGGGGSTGGLWTQNANFLYPTATFTECVLVGAQTSDFFGAAGQLGTTGTIGMMTAAANASLVYMFISPGVETQLVSNKSGTGTLLPLSFYCNGLRASISTGGVFYVGARTSDLTVSAGTVVSTSAFIVISATANASLIDLTIASGTCQLVSGATGTGTILPISFNLNSIASPFESARIRTGGSWLFGLQSSDVGDTLGWIVEKGVFGIVNAATNANALFLSVNGTTETIIHSSFSGTGTALPLSLYVNGHRYATVDPNGQFMVGFLTAADFPATGRVLAATDLVVANAGTNASFIRLIFTGGTGALQSGTTGTGTLQPIGFFLGGTEVGRWDATSQALFVGTTSTDIAPTKGMVVATSAYFLITTTTNASTFEIHAGSGVFEFISSSSGTGSIVPVRFNFGGTEVMRITTVGQVLVGLASSDASNNLGNIYISNFFGILSATTNAHALFMSINGSTETIIHSSFSGAGTSLPLSFYINGNRMATIDTNGALLLGLLSSDLSNAKGELIADVEVAVVTAATNATVIRLIQTAGTANYLQSTATGTGTTLPIAFSFGGTEVARLTTSGAYYVGVASSDFTNAAGVIVVGGNASSAFAVVSATANATYFQMSMTAGTEVFLDTNHTGTGTNLPLSVYVGGGLRSRWTIAGQFLVGFTDAGGDYTGSGGRIVASNDVIVATATTNSSFIRMIVTASTGELESGRTGTGTFLDMRFVTNAAEQARINTSGTFLLGLSSSDVGSTTGRLVCAERLYTVTAATNASTMFMGITAGTETFLSSNATGTGTQLPLSIFVSTFRVVKFIAANPGGAMVFTPLTVAQLPANQNGATAFVSDATSATFGAAAVGGGANKVPVYNTGAGWFIG